MSAESMRTDYHFMGLKEWATVTLGRGAGGVPEFRLRRFAAFGSRGDREKGAKGIIDRLRIWKSLGQFRIEEHHIGSAAVPGYVLAPHAAGKVVLRPHLNGTPLRRRFLHTFVSHDSLQSAR